MMGARLMNLAALAALLIAAGTLALAGARWFAQRPLFDFKRIEVRGELQHVTTASIRAAIAGRLRGNFFTLRLDDARRVLETVPWVAQASVRRVWPNRLRVTLREFRALGAWDDGRLLSDSGELFVANVAEAEVFGPLPTLGGPEDSAREVARRYYEIAAGLAPLSMTVDAIDVSERRSWTVRATGSEAGSTTFVLGRDDRPDVVLDRLADAVTAFPMVFARMGGLPERIDTRYANGLAAGPPARSPEPRNR
jgi:cell division protein FtsQ